MGFVGVWGLRFKGPLKGVYTGLGFRFWSLRFRGPLKGVYIV